eukprot:5729222-Amphidinium_carterae.1
MSVVRYSCSAPSFAGISPHGGSSIHAFRIHGWSDSLVVLNCIVPEGSTSISGLSETLESEKGAAAAATALQQQQHHID